MTMVALLSRMGKADVGALVTDFHDCFGKGRQEMSQTSPEVPAYVGDMLDRATAAAAEFAEFEYPQVRRILDAVARVGEQNAERLGHLAAEETGFGVAEDKVTKNFATIRQMMQEYAGKNYCDHRVDTEKKILLTPRPAGVIFGVTPSTGATAAIFFKVMSALISRNAIIISPHPAGKRVGAETVALLARAAEEAGAPKGAVQVLAEPTIPLVEAVMADRRTRLVLATGGGPVVSAAYHSGTPAFGVGPGNPPCIVDETADIAQAAENIYASKIFDNSILCTAESVVFAVESIAPRLLNELQARGSYICSREETQRLRDYAWPGGKFNAKVVGRFAVDIAKDAGFQVPAGTRVLIAQFDDVVDEEPLTHEKLSPILGFNVVPDFDTARRRAVELVRIVGLGHSAAIHSNDPQRVLDLSYELPTYRVAVNVPSCLGNAGIGTNLPITMSVGTGYLGGSSSEQNINPDLLVQWSSTVYSSDPSVRFPDFTHLRHERGGGTALNSQNLTEDLRRIVLEELQNLIGAR